jgi:hypothetical protein
MFLIATHLEQSNYQPNQKHGAAHLEQSNYLPNQKHGAIDKYDLTVYISSSQSHHTKRFGGDDPKP